MLLIELQFTLQLPRDHVKKEIILPITLSLQVTSDTLTFKQLIIENETLHPSPNNNCEYWITHFPRPSVKFVFQYLCMYSCIYVLRVYINYDGGIEATYSGFSDRRKGERKLKRFSLQIRC